MSTAASAVGLGLPRLEVREKVLGQAQYVDDMVRPRMLHGAILGSPIPHGRIISGLSSRTRWRWRARRCATSAIR